MVSRIVLIGLALALTGPFGLAQDGPAVDSQKQPAAPSGSRAARGESEMVLPRSNKGKVKVLLPADVPGELSRLKSKADIKADVAIRVSGTRPVIFKGVVRNGKLIEELVSDKDGRRPRFVARQELSSTYCGVRLWWSGDSDGYIFFRYSSIKTIALAGKLTDRERADIMRRLKAKKEGKDPDEADRASRDEAVDADLAKLSRKDLKRVLLERYTYDKGWNHERYRQLKNKHLIENKVLTKDEAIFVKHFEVLREARFELLKRRKTEKTEFEPGSAEDPESGEDRPRERG